MIVLPGHISYNDVTNIYELSRSYRFQKERPLKNLLMIKEGGCGGLSPGIGDISYVKDLQTQEIVTTKFRCSQFTSRNSKIYGYGWVGLKTVKFLMF